MIIQPEHLESKVVSAGDIDIVTGLDRKVVYKMFAELKKIL